MLQVNQTKLKQARKHAHPVAIDTHTRDRRSKAKAHRKLSIDRRQTR